MSLGLYKNVKPDLLTSFLYICTKTAKRNYAQMVSRIHAMILQHFKTLSFTDIRQI